MTSPLFYLRRPSLDEAPAEVVEVLLIEDSPPDAEIVIELLLDEVGPSAARFTHVQRLDEALQLLDERNFNIVLSDLSLPDAAGLAVVTSLQAAAPSLPIIVLSGGADIANAVLAVHAGAQDYLVKGRLDGNGLLRAVRYAIERKRTTDQLQQLLGTLEQRVAQRTVALKSANEQLRNEIIERQSADAALRASEAKYRELTELASDAILITDGDGNFIETNECAAEMLGYSRAELQQLNMLDIAVIANHAAASASIAEVNAGQSILRPGVMRRKDGTLLQTETSAKMLPDGRIQAIVRDVSERIRLEEERGSRLAAERAYSAKNDFLSRMSHELRTPLNAILGFGQLLEMDPLPPQQQESVTYIMQAGRNLLQLVDEVLDITSLDKGTIALNKEAIAIYDFLQASIAARAELAVARGISMIAELASTRATAVLADSDRLNRVMLNLLTNAIEYNHHGGTVLVSAALRTADGYLCIRITNTGPGIAADQLDRLFMPFERLGNATGAVQGTGLGLVLARLLIEEMGGNIGVESVPGVGTTFWVSLPLAGENAVQSP